LKIANWKLEIEKCKLEIGNWKLEIENCKLKIENFIFSIILHVLWKICWRQGKKDKIKK